MWEKQVFIDQTKCIGCKHCEIACALEHSNTKDIFSAIFETPLPVKRIFVEAASDLTTFPNKCRHCEIPFCAITCPTNALKRDEEKGLVLADESLCIGCGMCGLSCPFGVIIYVRSDNKKKIVLKCDGCEERVKNNKLPACVEACKTQALIFTTYEEFSKEKRLEITEKLTSPQIPFELTKELSLWRGMLKEISDLNRREVLKWV